MIDFGPFRYAGPPRTGTTWFRQSCETVLEVSRPRVAVHEPAKDLDAFTVCTIRNPISWLASYYAAIYPGHVGVPQVDVLNRLPRQNNFEGFVREYLKSVPGQVGRIYEAYPAHSYLRIEDAPGCLNELLLTFGYRPFRLQGRVNTRNKKSKRTVLSDRLKEAVYEAERETMEEFDYELRDLHSLPTEF